MMMAGRLLWALLHPLPPDFCYCCFPGRVNMEAPGTLSWLAGLIMLVAGVAVPLVVAGYRNRTALASTTAPPAWRR